MKSFPGRVVVTGVALWLATVLVPGVELGGENTTEQVLTLLGVALAFGLVNAVIKPVVKVLAFLLYILTLGLFALVVNALMFQLSAWVAGLFDLPFTVDGFTAALLGALVVSVVTALLAARD